MSIQSFFPCKRKKHTLICQNISNIKPQINSTQQITINIIKKNTTINRIIYIYNLFTFTLNNLFYTHTSRHALAENLQLSATKTLISEKKLF